MNIKEVLLLWIIRFFDKKSSDSAVAMLQNEQLAEELHEPIVKNFF